MSGKARKRANGHRKRPDEKLQDSVMNSLSLNRLKSTIRQTKRFLGKDDIQPATRIENERKLEALESQLGRAEQSKKEKKNATRYHGVKFKVLRRIVQAKAALESAADKAAKKQAQEELKQARIDLHYVLVRPCSHRADRQTFPNDRKYISLYPEGVYAVETAIADPATGEDPSADERARLRKRIRKDMKKGILSAEPEVELEQRSEALAAEASEADSGRQKRRRSDQDVAARPPKRSKATAADSAPPVEEDDFFETE